LIQSLSKYQTFFTEIEKHSQNLYGIKKSLPKLLSKKNKARVLTISELKTYIKGTITKTA
jgi:hypothetical protein